MTTATNLIRKSFDGITKVVDEAQGLVEAIVNTTGLTDLQNDVMEPGCWDGLCKAMSAGEVDYPSVLWGHDWAIPVGRVLHAEELQPGDARLKTANGSGVGGLRIIAQYNLDTQRGREAYSDVSKGVIKQWSVGFMPAEDGHKYDSKGIHRISKVGIWPEVSNVLVGASPGTRTTATKSAEAVLADPDMTRPDKALAIEQVCLQTVEAGDQTEALTIALSALHALGEEIVVPPPQIDMEAIVNLVVERLSASQPQSQYSDLEFINTSDDGDPLPSFARLNTRR